MWFVEAPFDTHELIADLLRAALGDAASITEQTDAWVAFDLAAPDLAPCWSGSAMSISRRCQQVMQPGP